MGCGDVLCLVWFLGNANVTCFLLQDGTSIDVLLYQPMVEVSASIYCCSTYMRTYRDFYGHYRMAMTDWRCAVVAHAGNGCRLAPVWETAASSVVA